MGVGAAGQEDIDVGQGPSGVTQQDCDKAMHENRNNNRDECS